MNRDLCVVALCGFQAGGARLGVAREICKAAGMSGDGNE